MLSSRLSASSLPPRGRQPSMLYLFVFAGLATSPSLQRAWPLGIFKCHVMRKPQPPASLASGHFSHDVAYKSQPPASLASGHFFCTMLGVALWYVVLGLAAGVGKPTCCDRVCQRSVVSHMCVTFHHHFHTFRHSGYASVTQASLAKCRWFQIVDKG